MKYFIEKGGKRAYIQLYEQIKSDIVSGIIKHNEKLPSKRTLAEETGVSVITVEHSLSLLYEEGFIESLERCGYFVVYSKGKNSDNWLIAPHKRVQTNVHNPPHAFPFSVYAKLSRKILADLGEKLFVKSPNNGIAELRCAISQYLGKNMGINAEPYQIVIGSGAEYLYNIIVAVLGRDKTYAIEQPSYDKIERIYRGSGVKIQYLKLGENGIVSKDLQNCTANVLHVTPFESFPSGVTATASKRAEYIAWATDKNGYLVEDDFGSEFSVFSKCEDTLFSLSQDERVIYLNSFSKTIAPSIRVAYMVLPKSLIKTYQKTIGFCSCTVPSFEQYLISEIISSGEFEKHINRTRRILRNKIKKDDKRI